jgi:hypothetical protein
MISWRDDGGGGTQLTAVVTDMGNVQKAAVALGNDMSAGADTSADEGALQTAASSLQSDAQTAQSNLPPSCVPHLRRDYGAALNDASKAAIDCENAVSELGSGSYSVATADILAGGKAIVATGKKFKAATRDIGALAGS